MVIGQWQKLLILDAGWACLVTLTATEEDDRTISGLKFEISESKVKICTKPCWRIS
ncbi:MAG: hypothetical protein JWM16_5767 [Verrucomicrobiales bacterium]|nr:hypothetical protein [Verrucomicrobiales bacterium]